MRRTFCCFAALYGCFLTINLPSTLADDSPAGVVTHDEEHKLSPGISNSPVDHFEFNIEIYELRGDAKSVLTSSGFAQTPSGMMRKKVKLFNPPELRSQLPTPAQTLVDSLQDLSLVEVVKALSMKSAGGIPSAVASTSVPSDLVYLVPIGDNRFESRTKSQFVAQSIELEVKRSEINKEGISEILVGVTHTDFDGRALVAGLEVGEPISTRRSWETTIHQSFDQEADAISIALSDDLHLLLVVEMVDQD